MTEENEKNIYNQFQCRECKQWLKRQLRAKQRKNACVCQFCYDKATLRKMTYSRMVMA